MSKQSKEWRELVGAQIVWHLEGHPQDFRKPLEDFDHRSITVMILYIKDLTKDFKGALWPLCGEYMFEVKERSKEFHSEVLSIACVHDNCSLN